MPELRELFFRHVCQTSDAPLGIEIAAADGCWITDVHGRRWLDFMSGICVCNVGHCNPDVVVAVRAQAERYLHPMVYGEYVMQPQVELATEIAALAPGDLDQVYFTNSGTEANEGALKLAKKATSRHRLIAFENSYHGDSQGSLAVTGREVYRRPFEPLLPDVTFLPFDDVDALAAIDETVAAVIVEPIQGEGGIRVPGDAFLPCLRDQCSRAGAVLIFDEVQTAMGRTGHWFAAEHWRVVPDVITVAKAFGGGMPLGGFISRAELMATLKTDPPLSHVTTFGGHPVSCAAGLAALRYTRAHKLCAAADATGEWLQAGLRALGEKIGGIREVRGKGLMIGVEFVSGAVAETFVCTCFRAGLILGWTLHTNRVVRIAPPLILSRDEGQTALDVMAESLAGVMRS